MCRSLRYIVVSGVLSSISALAQTPIVSSVVNGASYVAPPQLGHALAPGSLASVFGLHLASSTVAGSEPYTTSLGGTSVSLDGVAAPLLYVSPTQVNFQVPAAVAAPLSAAAYRQASLVLSTAAGSSQPFTVDLYLSGPGIFTTDGSGCGPGAVLNVRPDGSVSLNTPASSASPGDYLEIFGTGLGLPVAAIPDGSSAAGADPLQAYGLANLGGVVVQPAYSGRAPGLVGVDQLNVQVPGNIQEACQVPLFISGLPAVGSQNISVSIHSGGGVCVDPSRQSSGQMLLQRTLFLNSSQPEVDTLTASFSSYPSGSTPVASPPQSPGSCTLIYAPNALGAVAAPACGTPGIDALSVGSLTVTGTGLNPIPAITTNSRGSLVYTATLPPGSIGAGSFTVAASGAGAIAGFQNSLIAGAPIQITSQIASGSPFPAAQDSQFTLNWTGGDASEVVIVKFVQHGVMGDTGVSCAASGSDRLVKYSLWVVPPGNAGTPVLYYPFTPGQLDIVVDVVPATAGPVSAERGLAGGVSQAWMYEYRLTGLIFN